jgi:Flp pilus assembly protein TadD
MQGFSHRRISIWQASLSTAFLMATSAACATTFDEHMRNAMEYHFTDKTDATIAEYRQALEINPRSVAAHDQLGAILLEEKGDVDGAISEFVTALSYDPKCSFCQMHLDDAVAQKNNTAEEQINLGNRYYGNGQLVRSAAAYRIGMLSNPKDATAHNSLAWTLYRIGDLKEALSEVNEALRLKPDDAEFVNTLACIQFDLGEVDQAITTWRQAIALSKTPGPADLYGVAIGLLAKGDKQGAKESFDKAIQIDPKYAELDYVRDRIGMSVHTVAGHEQLLSLEKTADTSTKK